MNDPIVVRVAFLAPVAKGAVVELTYFGKGGLFGDVVYDEEPALVDRGRVIPSHATSRRRPRSSRRVSRARRSGDGGSITPIG